MEDKLRAWAQTGEYEDEPGPGAGRGGRFGPGGRLEGVKVAALIPVGMAIGALLAAAFLVRLLALPFQSAAGRSGEREP